MSLPYEQRFQIQTALSARIVLLTELAAKHEQSRDKTIANQLYIDLGNAQRARETVRCL